MDEIAETKLVNHDKIFTKGVRFFSKEAFKLDTNQEIPAHKVIGRLERLQRVFDYRATTLRYALNDQFDPRKEIIGDNEDDFNDTANGRYGNNDVTGPIESASHGTHVAGIILQSAGNSNIKVEIMSLRAVPCGGTDEYDKDVANAIVYAVDHGAQIINGSFGKSYSPNANKVKKAVEYAASQGVIIVHAAGNDGHDIDNPETPNYPNRYYADGVTSVPTWVEVGASDKKFGENLVASFSNYGKKAVDLFAPGVDIYSTIPNNGYAYFNGTSMASPVVAGTLAVLYSQFYNELAKDVNPGVAAINILLNSVRKDRYATLEVNKPGTSDKVMFPSLSRTGGIVDGYDAYKLGLSIFSK